MDIGYGMGEMRKQCSGRFDQCTQSLRQISSRKTLISSCVRLQGYPCRQRWLPCWFQGRKFSNLLSLILAMQVAIYILLGGEVNEETNSKWKERSMSHSALAVASLFLNLSFPHWHSFTLIHSFIHSFIRSSFPQLFMYLMLIFISCCSRIITHIV